MRIPFLGKRRKSVAALRSSAIAEDADAETMQHDQGHYKTVTQLANETHARLARSSFGAAGSLSTTDVNRHESGSSPLRAHSRHTMMTPVSAPISAGDPNQGKRTSLRSKASFLSRLTSRPSLSARYSSADLKSTARSHDDFLRPAGRSSASRPIVHQRQASLGDHDFFSRPRAAPSPPMLGLQSPNSSLLDSPPTTNDSSKPTSASTTNSLAIPGVSSRQASSEEPNMRRGTLQFSNRRLSTVPGSPASIPNSPRRRSISIRDQSAPPEKISALAAHESELMSSPVARRRNTHVRVGSEKVTLSVADVLESGLGVDIGDSEEESSYYDDSYDDKRPQAYGSHARTTNWRITNTPSGADSSDLPRLSDSNDSHCIVQGTSASQVTLESQSPLCILASNSGGADKGSPTQKASLNPNGRPSFFSASVDQLDRISECSIPASTKETTVKTSPELTQQLQTSLDAQSARFDRLAAHMLDIIQRHQNEKVQLETRISVLEKEARRSEKEIRSLRHLLSQSNQRVANANRVGTHRLTRATSTQSFLSNISFKDDEVDVSLAIDMLSRVSGLEVSQSQSSKDDWDVSALGMSPVASTPKKRHEMRRSRTMPNLHKAMLGRHPLSPAPVPSPLPVSPDISGGVGLGLDFPIPGPLNLPSISNAIISATGSSKSSIPALTAAPTVMSGLSLVSEESVDEGRIGQIVSEHESLVEEPVIVDERHFSQISSEMQVPKTPNSKDMAASQTPRSIREKRMAGEWRTGIGIQNTRLYRTCHPLPLPTAPPAYAVPEIPQGTSTPNAETSKEYSANLNNSILPPPIHHQHALERDSPDLNELFSRIVASGSNLLG